MDQRGLFF